RGFCESIHCQNLSEAFRERTPRAQLHVNHETHQNAQSIVIAKPARLPMSGKWARSLFCQLLVSLSVWFERVFNSLLDSRAGFGCGLLSGCNNQAFAISFEFKWCIRFNV